MKVDDKTVAIFMSLYQGRDDAWGSVEGRSNKEPVTKANYKRHLEGVVSLGVYPLLDDGTCYFFAIDLDQKDVNKALAIRQAFLDKGIHVYLAESKSKGFHVYGFGHFFARDVRRLSAAILNELKITAEIFPKHDYLDETVPLGNYINLPCFGHARPFINKKLETLPVSKALVAIEKIPKGAVEAIVKKLPSPVEPKIISRKNKGGSRKAKHPPCVEKMLNGVSAGSRDVAAFALARHFFDQGYLAEEILGLLTTWDALNRPPLGDQRYLEARVKSAEKHGYAFGCSSIMDEPLLANFCVGQDKCQWLAEIKRDKKKAGLIREQSFHETETHIFEEVIKDGKAQFLSYDKKTGDISYVSSVDYPGFTIIPIYDSAITEQAVSIPTGVEDYGETLDLVKELRDFIISYVDLPETDLEFSVWYILNSWVYDRLNTISYLRFIGDTGCGKSRSLNVVGRLCYKPMMLSGAVNPAPIYRLIRRFRGTLILDEADFKDSNEKNEVVTILNSGFERGRPVIRCQKDNPDNLEILPCFGPKVFATRFRFQDVALEARCLTFTVEETDREDIPPLLGTRFSKDCQKLVNKLLLWRLHHYQSIDPGAVEEIDLGHLEPRLKQLGLPYAIPFKDFPDVFERFKKFMQNYGLEIIKERAESTQGKIVHALFKMAQVHGTEYVSSSVISSCLSDEFKIEMSASKVGRILKSLNITTSQRRAVGGKARYLNWQDKLMRKLLRRYVPEPEDFEDLFSKDNSIDMEV